MPQHVTLQVMMEEAHPLSRTTSSDSLSMSFTISNSPSLTSVLPRGTITMSDISKMVQKDGNNPKINNLALTNHKIDLRKKRKDMNSTKIITERLK